jgi:methionyl-tRNA formyltransferase
VRLVFAGSPAVALPALSALAASRHELVGVVTRPDAPAGRGRRLRPSPVADAARGLDLPVLTPAHPREPAFQDALRDLAPDCCPVVAYGALVPEAALAVPAHGWVNLHFSLLPAYRGAAPVQHAILAGEQVTGATTFRLVRELDAGPVLGVMTEAVRRRDTAGDLLGRLATGGARLLVETLDGLESGALTPRPQPADGVSLAPKLTVQDGYVDFAAPAFAVDRRIRACTPSPGAWTLVRGERLKLGPVTDAEEVSGLAPGELRVDRDGVAIGTLTASVRLSEVQAVGKRRMPAGDWARGLRLEAGERVG